MSMVPVRAAMAATASLSRTSSLATSETPSLPSSARPFSSMSVAITVAPSRAKAVAQARPIPTAAAVTNARLPLRRSDIWIYIARTASMIIAGDADTAGDVAIAGREFHAGAGGMLPDGRAVEFLPRRLVGRVGEAPFCLELGAPPLQFLFRNQDIGAALVEVDADLVAGPQDRQPAIGRGLRRRVQDRRRARGAGLAAVADARQGQDAALDERGGRLHVDDFGAAGIAD